MRGCDTTWGGSGVAWEIAEEERVIAIGWATTTQVCDSKPVMWRRLWSRGMCIVNYCVEMTTTESGSGSHQPWTLEGATWVRVGHKMKNDIWCVRIFIFRVKKGIIIIRNKNFNGSKRVKPIWYVTNPLMDRVLMDWAVFTQIR